MKKITGFFMAILPFFVLVLLFISGLVIKSNTTVHVSSVNIVQDDHARKIEDLSDSKKNTFELEAKVFPKNANNPEVYWKSADEKVIQVDKYGTAKATGYGETYIYATSADDSTKMDRVKIEIYDEKIHSINVANTYELSYINLNTNTKIQVDTVPANHIINKTLKYSDYDTNKINVTADGWIIPKALGETEITISAASDPDIKQKVKVNVGEGVEKIEFKNQATTITDAQVLDVRDEIVTYPETDASKITNDDFDYETSDKDVAEVYQNHILFKKQEPVKVTATYKRNKNLKISKTFRSTCNNILSVNFNADQYEVTIGVNEQEKKYVETIVPNLNLNIYPTSDNLFTNLMVESSNNNVVEPRLNLETKKYEMVAKKPGTVTLLATAGDGTTTNPFMYDACLVTVLSPVHHDYAIISSDKFELDAGMFYFPLQKALTLDLNDKVAQDITFKILDDEGIAEIDSNNILQFDKAGTVKIKVYGDSESTSATFTVTAKDGTKELIYDASKTVQVIEAGQRYKFKNATPIFAGSYANKFNVNDKNEFSALCGQNISEFKIKDDQGNEKTIHLIVSEKPLYISHDLDTYCSTQQYDFRFKELANAAIVPSTALKDNGEPYKLEYTYTPAHESVATIENDVISFKQAGLVDVRIDCDGLKQPAVFKIKSTFGGIDKFDVYLGDEKIPSGHSTTIAPNQEVVLEVRGFARKDEAEQIDIESSSDTKLCSTSKEVTGSFLRGYTAKFTIKGLADMYGIETFALKTKTYATYININVTSEIQGFDVTYNQQVLKSGIETEKNPNLTFTNNLVLNVLPYPIIAKGETYSTTLDGTEISHTNNKITLSNLSVGEHKLVFSWVNNGKTLTKEYYFNYTTDYTQLKIGISEADNNQLYYGSNDTAVTYHLTTNGLVTTNFFESAAFKAELKNAEAKATLTSNILTISGLPVPDGTEYKDELTLKVNDQSIGVYPITRDIVSKIELPKHDNNDITDKKGLQKVHVYGNYSYYSNEEGLIDFYKLPVKIYDYKGNEIVNSEKTPNAKTNAMKTLVINIDKNSSAEYDGTKDCIKVKFSKESLYNEIEIANDEFDAKNGNKNVLINVHTKSNLANAKYTFVAVSGINAYVEESLLKLTDDIPCEKAAILQTNFGLDGVKDSAPITKHLSYLWMLYGNGYTIDFNTTFVKTEESAHYIGCSINAILQGCHDSTYEGNNRKHYIDFHQITFSTQGGGTKKIANIFAYSVYKNWTNSIEPSSNSGSEAGSYFFKNSLFYKNKFGCVMSSKDVYELYFENCVFFDCGSIPLLVAMNNPVHFKGYIGIYNFHGKEMLKNLFGFDISFMWPLIEKAAKANNMTEIGADGRLYVNSFMCTGLDKEIYFWNSKTKQYEKGTKGTPDAANFIAKYIDVNIPLTPLEAGLWATYNTTVSPNAFSYYQEFDKEGNIRPEFFQMQVDKVTRDIKFF